MHLHIGLSNIKNFPTLKGPEWISPGWLTVKPGAPIDCRDNILGGSDVVSLYVAITKDF